MVEPTIRETDLYAPVKALLVGQGYAVKGEVADADIVGVKDGDEPVVVELKTRFSLALFHQALERLKLSDAVYIAVPRGSGRGFHKKLKANITLCRRLGLGLITVRLRDGFCEVHLDPAPYAPRIVKPRRARLLREFAHRVGDPNEGGLTRAPVITAYRQDALRCLRLLSEAGPTKASVVAAVSGVPKARTIMADDHYGWFERVDTGIYAITPKGEQALETYADVIAQMSMADD